MRLLVNNNNSFIVMNYHYHEILNRLSTVSMIALEQYCSWVKL